MLLLTTVVICGSALQEALLFLPALVVGEQCWSEGREWEYLTDHDARNGFYSADLQTCKDECSRDPGCVSVNYLRRGTEECNWFRCMCQYNNARAADFPQDFKKTVLTEMHHRKIPCGRQRSEEGCYETYPYHWLYVENDDLTISETEVSLSECKSSCTNNPGCLSFNYFISPYGDGDVICTLLAANADSQPATEVDLLQENKQTYYELVDC